MSIFDEVTSFYDLVNVDEFHRYKSWEHCYSYFQTHEKIEVDYASLQLAFYLASWGMYRGSSYLLWKDYKIHKELIGIMSEEARVRASNNYDQENDTSNCAAIIELVSIVKKYYKAKISSVNGREVDVKPSDTLATKVLLGISGSVPAFDRFFKTGMKLHNFGTQINKKTLVQLFTFYREHRSEIDEAMRYIKSKSNVEYPPMKLIDMYFWEIGRKEKERSEKMKKENNLTSRST